MKKLNVQELPLDKKVIIEASAGTGKTFTLGLVVLRFLLEKLLPIEKIVLITFTEAATAELKKSTSEKIIEAYNIWKNGSGEENDMTAIIKRAKLKDRQKREANLLDAIARIDEMPVFTIHGFCRKLLSEFAYETGNLEDLEVVADTGEIIERVIADFWRENIKNSDITVKLTFGELSGSVGDVLNHQQAEIIGEDYEQVLIDHEQKDNEKIVKYAIACKLADEIRERLEIEKKKLKVIDFNDMIENCYSAIKNDSEHVLQNAVKKRYDAILVDEFQDTDKIQFAIFDYLFSGRPFFMIGDPKQAIYRFRGGDIFAYKESRNSAGENQYSMNVNYRSEKSLLSALNLFFEADYFKNKMGEGIDYYKAECGRHDLDPVIEKDREYKPFVIWKGQEGEKKDVFEEKAKIAVISEIKRLLNTGKFKPRDIAVLLDSNADCLSYKNELAKERIPAIVSGGSVLSSESANFLRILLNTACYNNNIKYIRALLTHNFCGFDTKEADEVFMEWANVIHKTRTMWEDYGVMNAISFFMDERNLWGRIAVGVNGERNIANIRQIMGILNNEEIKYGKIPEKLNNCFAALCTDANASDEAEEKLETDEDALKIMTIHKSKGLQFDIVFVPDVSRCPRPHKFPDVYMYHDGGEEIIAYFEENEKIKELAHQEENEESARLLYVALTRAKYRLYTVFSPCRKKKDGDFYKNSAVGRAVFEKFPPPKENFSVEDLDRIIKANEKKYSYNADKSGGESQKKSSKSLPENFSVEPAWSRTSFTSITKTFVYDDFVYTPPKTETTIPGGKRMGTLLHSIFENIDFNANDTEIQEIVDNKLGGFKEFSDTSDEGKTNKETIKHWVKTIMNKSLPGNAGKLYEIDSGKRIAELHFFMKSDGVDLQRIKEILNGKIPNFLDAKTLPDKYVNGAIDLIFLGKDGKYYILDWKSNSLSDFSKDGMEKEAMIRHGYHLQYYIYAVALKRWLEKTQKNFDFKKQFGGAYYIFIRGVNDEKEKFDGIFYASADNIAAGVAKLDECFKGTAHGK